MSFVLTSNKKVFVLFVLLFFFSIYAKEETQRLPNSFLQDKQSRVTWGFSVDALAWLASEEVSSIWADVVTVENNMSSWKALSFDFDWDYGFRIGAGHSFFYCDWDTVFYWTKFSTDAKHTIAHNPNAKITPEFFAAFLSGNVPYSMSVKWDLDLNMFDWELGKRYLVSKCLCLRPFIGFKGGWIHQSIHGKYDNLTIDNILTTKSGSEDLKNNFKGIGTLGGVNSKWRIHHFKSYFFDLFGDFSMATMWGRWECEDVYKNTSSYTSSVNMKNSTLGALMFRGFMGIEWGGCFNASKSSFSSKLGYEMQLWTNQLRFATFQLQRLHGDLSLAGFTLNFRFDF